MANESLPIDQNAKWHRNPGCTEEALTELRTKCGMDLPEKYIAFLRLCNGGEGNLTRDPWFLRILPAEEVADGAYSELIPDQLLAFGNNAAMEMFVFEKDKGAASPVFMLPYLNDGVADLLPVARDFSELLSLIGDADV